MTVGRFAPSPTGSLHIGNLRTALCAWLFARAEGGAFVIRVEDLDPVASRDDLVDEHLDDLAALGIESDAPIIRQSDPSVRSRHEAAIAELESAGLVYPCFCSRREIAEAVAASHGDGPELAYPGTCRDLSDARREQRAEKLALDGRSPALRVRSDDEVVTVTDRIAGEVTALIDDFVVRRGDGVPAYNVAVVVDDAAQNITQVVRGDDLLSGTPRQVWLGRRLGLEQPEYAHVPLVVGPDGQRLAKRHGSVTRRDLGTLGVGDVELLALLGSSLGLCRSDEPVSIEVLLQRFDGDRIPGDVWTFGPVDS